MALLSITTLNRGSAPGDGTGDTAYVGAGTINTNFSNVKAKVDLILDVPQNYLIGRTTASTGDAEQLTATQVRTILNVANGANAYVHPNHSGDVTSVADGAQTIAANAVTYAKMQQASAGYSVMAKAGTGAGNYAELAAGTDGVLRRSGSGDLAFGTVGTTNIADAAVTLAKMANMATASVFYRKTAGSGAPEVQTLATLKTDLGLTGTNSGDQTSIAGITGTKSQFNTAVTDGDFLYVGDVTGYTHPNHSGHVTSTGDGATVLTVSGISGQTDIGAALVGTDQFLVNDGGAIRRTDVSRVATYCATNMSNVAVTGTITATGDITAYFTSDMALKQNIEPITSALDKVSGLSGSRYQYTNKEGTFYGLMAQDVQKVMPELVHTNADGHLTIRWTGFELVALLVEAVKELKGRLDDITSSQSS